MNYVEPQHQELTFGQKAVGLKFNPSGDETVNKAKQLSADLIDLVEDKYKERLNKLTTVTRQLSWMENVLRTAAFNAIIAAQMAVVKFLTWND